MRQLTLFDDERRARRLGDALFMEGVDNTVNEARNKSFAVWVHDDEKMAEAKELLAEFEADPEATRFGEATKRATKQRKRETATRDKAVARADKVRERMATEGERGLGYLTMFLVLACVGVAFLTDLGQSEPGSIERARHMALIFWWPSILEGEVWRLITPIFLHLDIVHIVFNMMLLAYLGSMIERRHSTLYLFALVLLSALVSNFAQAFVSGHEFGGISGVVYALFGFLLLRGRFDRSYGTLPEGTIFLMGAWFVLGFVMTFAGTVPIANTAHAGGFVVGAIWGYLSSGHLGRRPR